MLKWVLADQKYDKPKKGIQSLLEKASENLSEALRLRLMTRSSVTLDLAVFPNVLLT